MKASIKTVKTVNGNYNRIYVKVDYKERLKRNKDAKSVSQIFKNNFDADFLKESLSKGETVKKFVETKKAHLQTFVSECEALASAKGKQLSIFDIVGLYLAYKDENFVDDFNPYK